MGFAGAGGTIEIKKVFSAIPFSKLPRKMVGALVAGADDEIVEAEF